MTSGKTIAQEVATELALYTTLNGCLCNMQCFVVLFNGISTSLSGFMHTFPHILKKELGVDLATLKGSLAIHKD